MRVFSIKIQSKNIHKYFCLIWKYSIVWTLPCVVPVFMCSAVFQCDNNYSFIITINVTDIQKPPTWFCCTLHRCFFKFFFEICSVWGVEASDRLAGDILDQSERSKIKTRGSAWEHDAIAHSMQQSGPNEFSLYRTEGLQTNIDARRLTNNNLRCLVTPILLILIQIANTKKITPVF